MRSWLSDCSPIKAKRVTWSWRDIGVFHMVQPLPPNSSTLACRSSSPACSSPQPAERPVIRKQTGKCGRHEPTSVCNVPITPSTWVEFPAFRQYESTRRVSCNPANDPSTTRMSS